MLCSAGVGFDPIIDGTRTLFGMEGSWRASATMYDTDTKSIWLQLTGECVAGERKGMKLKPLPGVIHTTWQRWQALYPKTSVLDHRLDQLGAGHRYMSRDRVRSGNPYLPDELRPLVRLTDERLTAMELVLGVALQQSSMAFPLVSLHLRPVVETELEGIPATIWYDATVQTAVAFDRRIGGKPLAFTMIGPGRFSDQTSGSTWTMDGLCINGTHRGARLRPLPSVLVEWYAWTAAHPGTRVWGSKGP